MFGRGRKQDGTRLEQWKERFSHNKTAYAGEYSRMDWREELYRGTKKIKGAEGARKVKPAAHVRNLVAELVESQVSSSIPQPKVTALRPEDEDKARLIEDMLRNELDRLPLEYNNDQEERTVPIQGGALSLVEWDSTKRTHKTTGELSVTFHHPKELTPQDGVYTDLEDMDYFFMEVPQTKAYLRRRYGADVGDLREDAPEVRGTDGKQTGSEDLVTQVLAYYRNDKGGIGLFSWAGDTVLEDLEDYQARRVYTCARCGERGDGKECGFCASKRFQERAEEHETLAEDITTTDGRVIPARSPMLDQWGMPVMGRTEERPNPLVGWLGMSGGISGGVPDLPMGAGVEPMTEPTKIPYYKPDVYPLVLRKNVSIYGKFLGDSDVDKIEDQQETTNKLSTKVLDKVFRGGSVLTAPMDAPMDFTDEDLRVLRLRDPSQATMIGVYNLQPNITGDLTLRQEIYEEARQIIGITDSFQGRRDATATSGKAKEFSARQSAGRLESKRTMKDAAYSRLFEVMFKFMLAYSDEPRTIVSTDNQGHRKYETFYRYDFLERDEAGAWYWNDRFLFSVDASATLANNREAMWQETRMNFQQGAYGDPTSLDTLIVFWTRMELLHYPGASDTRTYLEEKKKQEEAAIAAQAQMGAMGGAGGMPDMGTGGPALTPVAQGAGMDGGGMA